MKTPLSCLRVVPFVFVLAPLATLGQEPVVVRDKVVPASLELTPFILDESVVTHQWPVILQKVNAPTYLTELNPGQCIRIGAVVTGDDSISFFKQPQIGFVVHFAGHDSDIPLASATDLKEIKPVGLDVIQSILDKSGLKYQVPFASAMAASPGMWCVPGDALAGEVKIETSIVNGGKKTSLKSVKLTVLSPEKPGKPPFTDKTVDEWLQTYYRHPQPEFLIALMPSIFQHDNAANSMQQFVVSAMKRDPAVVARLGPQLAKADPQSQAMMVKLAAEAGIDMKIPFELSPMQKEFVAKLPDLADAFHPVADIHIGEKQDMLWSMFLATGDRAPVDSIIGMLGWRADYEAFAKMREAHQEITELTPSIAHAVAYSAAGWSIGSFQRTDPLVADYIAATIADPKTPEAIRKELQSLDSNPAFKKQ